MCFLIPALVGLISAILGYLLGKMMSGGNDLNLKSKLEHCETTNENLNTKIYLVERELNELKNKNISSSVDTKLGFISAEGKKKKIAPKKAKEKKITFDSALALAEFGQKVKLDDLKIVEGIGPKIEELYHTAGIKTWKKLSETPVEKSRKILDSAGNRYAIHNPETWAKQAELAYKGKWKELKEYQNSLNAGRV